MPASTEPLGDASLYSASGVASCSRMRAFLREKLGGGGGGGGGDAMVVGSPFFNLFFCVFGFLFGRKRMMGENQGKRKGGWTEGQRGEAGMSMISGRYLSWMSRCAVG